MEDLGFTGPRVRDDIIAKYGPQGDLLDILAAGGDQMIHKWHHYIPLYERYFGTWRNRPLRFLEIGVFRGGSLSMWRRYFGPEAMIFGIDIDPTCAAYDGSAGQVRIGSQDDPEFLARTVEEMGGVDIVLDDGSHMLPHIRTSFEALFPCVTPGGLYMVEDLHTAYWRTYGGGYRNGGNFFNFVRKMADDLHAAYHDHGCRHDSVSRHCSGMHIHDSIVVFDRAEHMVPTHSRVMRQPE